MDNKTQPKPKGRRIKLDTAKQPAKMPDAKEIKQAAKLAKRAGLNDYFEATSGIIDAV